MNKLKKYGFKVLEIGIVAIFTVYVLTGVVAKGLQFIDIGSSGCIPVLIGEICISE